MPRAIAEATEDIQSWTMRTIDSSITQLELTLKLCVSVTDPMHIVETQQAHMAKLRDAITALKQIKERPL
jgi:hypothetical protein